ncbi:gamma-aminobutyric acid receptor subunit beta-2-like isoform X2 [Rhopilema esculentum]
MPALYTLIIATVFSSCTSLHTSVGNGKTTTPRVLKNAFTTMNPTTVYGIKTRRRNESHVTTMPNTVVPTIHYSAVSKIYAQLLLSYDKKFRPFYGEKPVEVIIDCHVLSFGDINEVEMEYTLDVYFLQIWFDPRFNVSDKRYENATVELIGPQLQDLWLPDTIFVNSKRSKFHAITIDNRFLTIYLSDGMIAYHSRITMTAACRMDLRRYPFDTQQCKLAIESYGHDQNQVKYTWRQDQGCRHECNKVYIYDKDMANFEILEAKKTKEATVYHAENFSKATASFVFRRRRQYFIFRIYIPSILIVMVSWSTFWISQDAVPARAGICITTILTLITMLGVVNTNMPKVSYIKAIDLYLLVSFIFVFSSLVEYIIVLNFENCFLKKRNRKDNTKWNEDHSHIIKTNGSISVTVKAEEELSEEQPLGYFGGSKGCVRRQSSISSTHRNNDLSLEDKLARKLNKIKYNWQKPAKRPPPHLVDLIARVLFPFIYGLFNFIYWWTQIR